MASAGNGTATLYAKLQDRYLARDQVGATGVFHELVKAGRAYVKISAAYRISDKAPDFPEKTTSSAATSSRVIGLVLVPNRLICSKFETAGGPAETTGELAANSCTA